MTWEEIKNKLTNEEAIRLVIAYSNYVMDGLEREIEPVCVAEFYDNDYEKPTTKMTKIEMEERVAEFCLEA